MPAEKQPAYAAPVNAQGRKAVIDVRGITKIYKMGDIEVPALRGVDLRVYEGEFVSIMGPSGSGKSTMLQILGALDQPTSGAYYLDGVDVAKLKDTDLAMIRNRKIGFVFQSFNLLKRTTAQRQVELPLIYAGTSDRSKRARAALEAVGLGERMQHLPSELSGGQQQRVAIARAIVTDPAIVLADEPTGNLDSRSGTEVLKIFQKMNREHRITTVFVTHDTFVARHTDRIIMLRDGLIVADEIVPNPIEAGTVERPSESAELDSLLKETFYGGVREEFADAAD
jgi:putative ABC transport system ATP-binding protein